MVMQSSFSGVEDASKKKRTRRDRLLAQIETVTAWQDLEQVIGPFYPKDDSRARPPIGLTRMLRIYVAQRSFGLSN